MKTMKSRFFALTGHTLTYYASEEDLYSEDGDSIGSIRVFELSGIPFGSNI